MRFVYCYFIFLVVAVSGYAQSGSPSAGCLPLEVDFTPPDGGTIFWDFGDGVTSALTSPSHVYTAAGTYTVTAFRVQGGSVLGTTTITVYPTPILELTQDTSAGCAPLAVNFEVEASSVPGVNIQGYNWAFGDGTSGDGITTANTYTRAGIYDVSVALETNFSTCNVTEIFEDAVTVYAPPAVAFTTDPSPPQSCDVPLTVGLSNRTTGNEPITYAWNFGNGTTSSDADPDPAVYSSAGAYTITLTGTDDNGCSASASAAVSAGPPSANFNLPDTVCFNEVYRVRPLGAADVFDYTFGPGIAVISDEGPIQAIQFIATGTTTISLAVENTAEGCSADTTRTLFVQRPFVDAVSDPSYFCESPYTINYSVNNPDVGIFWEFIDNFGTSTARDTSITYTYDEGGVYGQNWLEYIGAQVTITTPQGCRADTVLRDIIDVPNALFIPDVHQGCAPLTVNFADSVRSTDAVSSYVINWGDGQQETFTQPGPWPHTYTQPGEYEAFISIENSRGCRDTSYAIPIQVGEAISGLSYDVLAPGTCPGDTIVLINTTDDSRIDAFHFEVEGGESHHCFDQDTLEHVIANTIDGGTIDFTFSVEYNGCISEVTDQINYTDGPRAEVGWLTTCENPFDFTFYNRATGSTSDSLIVLGTDTMFRDAYAITDSLELTMPRRGAYQVVLASTNASSVCPAAADTVSVFATEPIADFDIDSLLCAGLPLVLDGSPSQDVNATCSKGYQWDFSWRRPYVTDEAMNSDVTADARGLQQISLIVEDINGCVDTTTKEVRLYATELTPSADDLRICLPATVNFDVGVDADTTVVDYMWEFGGFGSASTQQASNTFPDLPFVGSEIVVTVMTTDELGCPGAAEIVLSVYEPFSQVFTSPSTGAICLGESIEFTATDFTDEGSSLRYSWDFGNGQTSQNRIETVTYDQNSGDFNVELVYTEIATGCQNDTTFTVQVQVPPDLSFTSSVDGQPTVCFPEIITFTNTSTSDFAYTPIWIGGPVPAVGDEYTAALDRGTTTINLLGITSAGCADTLSRDFTLVGPEGGFDFSPNDICPGTDVTFVLLDTVDVEEWTWDFGNGVTEMNTDPATASYDFRPPSGFTVVSVTFSSQSNECTFTAVDTLRFQEIEAAFVTSDGADFACDPEVMFLDRSINASTYSYDFGGVGTSNQPSPSFTFPGPGTYTVQLAVADANDLCRDTSALLITVLEPLGLSVTTDSVCAAESSVITVNTSRPVSSILLNPDDIIASQDSNMFTTVALNESQTLSVTVVDSFGCTDELPSVDITVAAVFQQPNDTFVILSGSEVTLPIENPGGFVFTWSDPDAVGCTSCDNPTVAPTETTTYVVTVRDQIGATGCTETTVTFLVIVAEEPQVPNLFTPDNDGTNDDWGPLFPEGIQPQVTTYQVYSRWGTLVFDSDNASDRWLGDNNGNGEPMPSDVYAYVIQFVYPDGSEFNDAGEVTLLR